MASHGKRKRTGLYTRKSCKDKWTESTPLKQSSLLQGEVREDHKWSKCHTAMLTIKFIEMWNAMLPKSQKKLRNINKAPKTKSQD